MKLFVTVSTSLTPGRDIVNIVRAANREGDVLQAVHESEVSAFIFDSWQLNFSATGYPLCPHFGTLAASTRLRDWIFLKFCLTANCIPLQPTIFSTKPSTADVAPVKPFYIIMPIFLR